MKNAIFFLVIAGLFALVLSDPVEPEQNHVENAKGSDREGRFFFGRMGGWGYPRYGYGYGYPYYGGYGGYGRRYGWGGYGGYGYPYYWG